MALALAGLVTAGVALALRTGLDASDRIRERSDVHAEARAALEVLAADLAAAYLSGVNTQQTLFQAEPAASVPSGEAFLSFTTLSYRRNWGNVMAMQEPRSDAVRVDYALQPSPDGAGPALLARRERWLTETGPGVTEVVCEGVTGIRLRFSDGTDLQEAWSAEAEENPPLAVSPSEEAGLGSSVRRLPRVVEITLLLASRSGAGEGPQRVYRTAVHVRADGTAPFETEVVAPPDPGGTGAPGGDGGTGGGNGGTVGPG